MNSLALSLGSFLLFVGITFPFTTIIAFTLLAIKKNNMLWFFLFYLLVLPTCFGIGCYIENEAYKIIVNA